MAETSLELALAAVFGASGALLAGLLYFVYRYREARGTREFAVVLAIASLWSFSAALKLILPRWIEHVSVSLELFYGVVFVVAFFVFASEYTGRPVHRHRWFGVGVTGVIGVMLALLVTNRYHGLLWMDIELSTAVFPHLVHVGKGPVYWAALVGSYVLLFVGLYYLLDLHVRSRYNTQSILLVSGGAAVAVSANLVSLLDVAVAVTIPGLDYTPFGLVVFGVATTTAIHQDLFAIIPIARDTAVEFSGEGMIICDAERTIRDYNDAATHLFPDLPTREGQPITTVLPRTLVRFDETESHRGEMEISPGGERRIVDVRATPISEGAHHLGWTVVCNDVTEQKRRERHLSLVARVLRHNMSNEITIIQGKAELLRGDVSEDAREHLDTITESSDRIMSTSAKLRTIQEIVTDDRGPVPMNLGRFVESVVTDVSEKYPEATIEYDAVDLWVRSTTGLGAALENLVENGIVHSDVTAPWVAVEIDADDDEVVVSVCDDGPGIPPSEQQILDEGETPLEHSSGVGLWLVYRFVERSGRDLTFERQDNGGSRVSFVLDRADEPE